MVSSKQSILKGHILIVDDTPANLRLMVGILNEAGYKVRSALNGQLALSGARAIPPDLILLDIMMPDLDGYSVCKFLKLDPKTREIPVIFISALDNPNDKVRAFEVGGVDYIPKPVHKDELLARVEHQLRLRFLQRQLKAQNIQLQQKTTALETFSFDLKQLHRLNTTEYQSFEALCTDYLETGCQILGFATGSIWLFEGQKIAPLLVYPPPPEGADLVLEEAAEKVIRTRRSVAENGIDLETVYLGTPIWVDSHFYGILNFKTPTAMPIPIARHNIEIIELMAQGLGKIIAARENDRLRQQSEQETQLLLSVTQAINQAPDFETALLVSLEKVCQMSGWSYGEAWIPREDGTVLEAAGAWYSASPAIAPEAFQCFHTESQKRQWHPGEGMPGRVWQSGEPESLRIGDTSVEHFPRTEIALKSGFKACLGVPIIASASPLFPFPFPLNPAIAREKGEVLAVLLFFLSEPAGDIEHRAELVWAVALQLGTVILQKQIEAEQRAIFAAMDDSILVFNAQGRCLKIVSGNPDILVKEPSTLINSTILENLPEATAAQHLAAIQTALETKQTQRIEYSLTINSKLFWFSGKISPLSEKTVILVIENITEQKEAELSLKESEHRYRELIEVQNDVLICRWLPDTTLTFVNQTYCNFLGRSPAQLLGSQLITTLPNQNAQAITQSYIADLLTDLKPSQNERPLCSKSGEIHWFSWTDQPILDRQGQLIEFQSFGVDITARKEREDALNLIVEGTSATTGQEFFYTCAHALAELLGVRYTLIAEFADQDKTRARSLAFWQGPDFGENIEYDLAGTPCNNVVRDRQICYYPDQIPELFPTDEFLAVLNIKSYCGIPLVDSNSNIVGFIATFDSNPLPPELPPNKKLILQIFAARTGAELERKHAEEALQHQANKDRLLSRISRIFIDQNLDTAINFTLPLICDFFGGDRCYIFRYNEEGTHWQVTHEWQEAKSENMSVPFDLMAIDALPWLHEQLQHQSLIHIPSSQKMPVMDPEMQSVMQSCSTQSLLIVPLLKSEMIEQSVHQSSESNRRGWRGDAKTSVGFIGIDTIDHSEQWSHEQIAWLRLVGEFIAIATVRQQAEDALRLSVKRERTVARVLERMHETLEMEAIFTTTTEELHQLLGCDRVAIYRFNPDWSGEFVAEAVSPGWQRFVNPREPHFFDNTTAQAKCELQGKLVEDTFLQRSQGGIYNRGIVYRTVRDIYEAGFDPCYLKLLETIQARSYTIIPIFCGDTLWGLLAAYHNANPKEWKKTEISVLVQIGNQLGVALQQAELLAALSKQSTELKKAKETADAANRAKSDFLAKMSHELRTPLNAILGFTQVLNRNPSLGREQQEYLGIINRSGEHLLALINDVLEMSKIEAGRMALKENDFDLFRLLDSMEEMLQLKAKSKGLSLRFERSPQVPQYIHADESKLRQILINLLGNAIKFTEKGHAVLRVSTPEPSFEASNVALHFEVDDTGPGIAPEDLDKLFNAFSQAVTGVKASEGTGLGLAISQKFVQLMGGEINVESTLNQGSSFSFKISVGLVDSQPTPQQPPRKILGLVPNQQVYRILVVEDTRTNRLLMVKLLSSLGFEVREAKNGAEAIELWQSWQPHLIWMDMQMPVMNGYEATQIIKAQPKGKDTTIIALTASAFEEERQVVLSIGCDDFVGKPFQEDELLEKMSQHLGVRYIYEDIKATVSEQEPVSFSLLSDLQVREKLANFSQEWRQNLYDAATQCSDTLIMQLIDQISLDQVSLITTLTNLVENFRFDKLMVLIPLEKME